MDVNALVEMLSIVGAISTPVAAVAAVMWRKVTIMSRTITALNKAIEHGDAHNKGVLIVLTYPGCKKSAVSLLTLNNWKICEYHVMEKEGILPTGEAVMEDLKEADAVVTQGLTETQADELANHRAFRDALRIGTGVVLYTGGPNYRYDLLPWSDADTFANMPANCEAAVRNAMTRRELVARRQGIRPGRLADARAKLVR